MQTGQPERFTAIVARHQSGLFRYAAGALGCRTAAEDAVQETFLSVYRSRMSFDPERDFASWLWTIHYRQCQRHCPKSQFQLGSEIEPIDGAKPGERIERADERDRLLRLLAELPEDQAEALRLRYFGELTFAQIGAAMGSTEATAKSRVRYGLEKLSRRIRETEEISV